MQDGTAFVKNILMKLKSAHILNYLLPDKRHSEYNIRREMCTCYQLLKRIDSVTPLYRGLYTTASKQVY